MIEHRPSHLTSANVRTLQCRRVVISNYRFNIAQRTILPSQIISSTLLRAQLRRLYGHYSCHLGQKNKVVVYIQRPFAYCITAQVIFSRFAIALNRVKKTSLNAAETKYILGEMI